MSKYIRKFGSFWMLWLKEEKAIAAMEAAFVFPILLTLLLGVFDLGNAVLANQKVIRASQVVADLITRDRIVSAGDIDEAVMAGSLAIVPFDAGSYGVDIVSIRFVENDEMDVVWRETRNMTGIANLNERTAALAEDGNGVMVVTVEYLFEPLFSGFVVDHILMQETAFTRGRRSAVVCKEGAPGC